MKNVTIIVIASLLFILALIFIPMSMEESKIVDYQIESGNGDNGLVYSIRVIYENYPDQYIRCYGKSLDEVIEYRNELLKTLK
jgi:hypothetical protein